MFKKLQNIISQNKIKGYCRICNKPIYNLNTSWGMRGICVYCGEAYREGKIKGEEKITDNDYGYKWYTNEEIKKVLTIEMIKKGYWQSYDEFFKLYRIVKK